MLCRLSHARHEVPSIDGIVLTHDHADAMLGLDDVRSIQVKGSRTGSVTDASGSRIEFGEICSSYG